MKLLAIETSNRPLSVAVLDETRVLATTTTNVGRNHSSTLLPIIEKSISQAGLTADDLDRVVEMFKGNSKDCGCSLNVTVLSQRLSSSRQLLLIRKTALH